MVRSVQRQCCGVIPLGDVELQAGPLAEALTFYRRDQLSLDEVCLSTKPSGSAWSSQQEIRVQRFSRL